MKQKLTQNTIANLKKPEQGNYIVWDTEVPGFGVRITANDVAAYILDYRINRRRHRYTIGSPPEWTLTAARDRAIEIRRGIRDGIDPLSERIQDRSAKTMNDLADDYVSRHALRHKRPGSIRNDTGMLTSIIRPRLGTYPVKAIIKRDIEDLHASLASTPYHANRVISLLNTMFNLAVEWGWRPDNPAKGIQRNPEYPKDNAQPVEAINRFTDALDEYRDQVAADAIRLLVFSGCRENEGLAAHSRMFSNAGIWTKPAHTTKENKEQHVPLNDEAWEVVQRRVQDIGGSGYLFPGATPGKPRVAIIKPFTAICKAAGLATKYYVEGKRIDPKTGKPRLLPRWKPTIRIHDLRHQFASDLVSSGEDITQVGKLMGHVRPETTNRYAKYATSTLRDTSNRLGSYRAAGRVQSTPPIGRPKLVPRTPKKKAR